MALGKRHSRFLGQFPGGAYRDALDKRRIIAAVCGDDEVCGYILYRVSREHATIVHLCVDSQYQGRGLARSLFEAVRNATTECHGVRLSCRRDFPAASMWPRLGFVSVNEKLGRSQAGSLLTNWYYSYGVPDLFADLEERQSRALAVMDANVVFDLQDQPDRRKVGSISADWLSPEIELCVTDEMYNEIGRAADPEERSRRRSFLNSFKCLPARSEAVERLVGELRPLFPAQMSVSDDSDLRHLAKAIASDAAFFITFDEKQLGRAKKIEAQYRTLILKPVDLVVRLDAHLRQAEYVPARVAGSLSTVARISGPEINALIRSFQDFARREAKTAFDTKLTAAVADPHRHETCVVTQPDGRRVALFVWDRSRSDQLAVPLFRIANGIVLDGLSHYVLWQSVTTAAREGRLLVEVSEPLLHPSAEQALRQIGFVEVDGVWRKHVIRMCGTRAEVVKAIDERKALSPDRVLESAAEALTARDSASDRHSIARLEQLFWPVRIVDTALESWIIPIQPGWAARLLDERLANQDLFGADPHLALSLRNVYYRSARPPYIQAPARILWYVSGKGRRWEGASALRAVSLADEVVRGPAKTLFSRFRRLGAYEWSHVLEKAEGDPHGLIAGLSFTHTELLRHPVPYEKIQRILFAHGMKRNTFAGPVRVSSSCFADLYREANAPSGTE
jgi:GNAT superfamily N-acetyltransferase